MNEYYDEGHSFNRDTNTQQRLTHFYLGATEVTPDDIQYFRDTYSVNLEECSTTVIELLINFKKHGASAAIMNLISKLSKES